MILPRYFLDTLLLPNSTPGSWYDTDHKTLIAKTLELPWRNNAMSTDWNKASCIPAAIYLLRLEPPKPSRPYPYFRVVHVPGRNYEPLYNASNVLVHPANRVDQLLGCIAPGSRHTVLEGDGVGVADSIKKLDWMVRNLPKIFELQVTREKPV